MADLELIAIREAARRLNVSDTAVRKAIASNRISAPTEQDKDPGNGRPRLRWPQCRDEWLANSDTSKRSHVGSRGSPRREAGAMVDLPTSDRMDELPTATSGKGGEAKGPKSGRDANYAQARAAREVFQAKLAKLEYEQKTGALVNADDVKAAWAKHITAAKTRILGIPASCKSRYADLPLAAIAVIEQVCREALEDLANGRD